jgi:zinc transport system substrate-binding protein
MKKGFLSLIALLSIVSCGNNANNDKLSIACSFAPVYDLAYRIAGDKATITNICGNNEPHEFSPSTAKEVAIAERCDVLFGYGHSIDSWAKKLNTDKYFEITTSNEFENDDPHAWLSLKESLKMLKVVYEKIVELDSSNKDYYLENYTKAVNEFNALDTKYTEALSSITTSKYIVTSHEAFYYLARDYSFKQVGIADIADHEPTSSRIQQVINIIKENSIKTIYVEELDSVGNVQTIVDELKKDNYEVSLKVLKSYEAVSEEEYANGETYLKVMEDNLTELKNN